VPPISSSHRWLRSDRLRWGFAALLLLASALNYVDRQALSILAPVMQRELHISNGQYGYIVEAFLIFYTVMYLLSGRLVDRISARFSETMFLAGWSAAGVLTAFITGFRSLLSVRCLLGASEPGNFTAASKVVSEWFPPEERGTAVGMYSMGGTIGAAIAAPLVAYLAIRYGWRSAFVITGAIGFLLAFAWLLLYRSPEQCGQRSYVHANSEGRAASLRVLLASKAFWGIVLTRMITDPVWYFYLFWFPKYLQEERGMSLAMVGKLLWLIFVAADLGSLVGGMAASRRIRNGSSPVQTRVRIMAYAAVIPCFAFVIPALPGYVLPLTAACCAAFAHMAWMTNATTLPLDIFPAASIGSVQGMAGTLGSLASLVSTALITFSVTHLSYAPVFVVASFLYPIAFIVLLQIPGARLKGAHR
jgi:ACS family hexuronate transporter-like MFS transporter